MQYIKAKHRILFLFLVRFGVFSVRGSCYSACSVHRAPTRCCRINCTARRCSQPPSQIHGIKMKVIRPIWLWYRREREREGRAKSIERKKLHMYLCTFDCAMRISAIHKLGTDQMRKWYVPNRSSRVRVPCASARKVLRQKIIIATSPGRWQRSRRRLCYVVVVASATIWWHRQE